MFWPKTILFSHNFRPSSAIRLTQYLSVCLLWLDRVHEWNDFARDTRPTVNSKRIQTTRRPQRCVRDRTNTKQSDCFVTVPVFSTPMPGSTGSAPFFAGAQQQPAQATGFTTSQGTVRVVLADTSNACESYHCYCQDSYGVLRSVERIWPFCIL